jgi:hypothetical protein
LVLYQTYKYDKTPWDQAMNLQNIK